jgi:transcriptional regulator with XRE-family HTH domain
MVRAVNEIDKIIGARLKTARLSAGIRQADLAKAIGSSFQQIQKYENGVNRISSVALLSLAQMLHVPVLYFYDGLLPSGPITKKSGANEIGQADLAKFASTRQGTALLRKFLAIKKPEVRQQILDLLGSLAL